MKTGGQAAARRIARALLEVAEKKGEAAAAQTGLRQVLSALHDLLVRALEQAIHKTTGLTADLSEKTDPAVVGGVLLKMGGHTYDGTVRGRLQALRRVLKGETRS